MISKKNISIIMPVLNETWSLKQVTTLVLEQNSNEILEIIIPIHPQKTITASKEVIEELKNQYGNLIKPLEQKLPFLGGALRTAFKEAQGDFVLLMASDLETDPNLVKTFIEKAQNNEADIVTASRWLDGGGFKNYHPLKKFLNKCFQFFFSKLYSCKLTDLTYGFRILRTSIVKEINWQELKHPIFFELLLKPLKLGYKIIEIPAQWEARQEGESQISLRDYFDYFLLGLRLKFSKVEKQSF